MPPERHHYKNPPIEEALCELHFKPGRDWDLTIPGKLQAEFGSEYSGKPREQKAVQVELQVQGGRPSNLQYDEGLAKVQLVTTDGKRMVGVGRDALSIHMLHPYQNPHNPDRSGWDEFKRRISAALDAYWKVAEPIGVNRIGVRYINKIVVPQRTARVEEYLRCALPEVSELPDNLRTFVSRVEYIYDDRVHLVLSQGLISAPLDHIGFILDLDVIWQGTEMMVQDEVLEKVSDLRILERTAFETVITDKARELFDAD